MSIRKYRIICMKRSKIAAMTDKTYFYEWFQESDLVYWRENRAGYTSFPEEAGEYTAEELEACAGSHGDWMLEPICDAAALVVE